MKTPGILVGFLRAQVLCLFWLTKHTVDSVQLSAPQVVRAAPGESVTVPCQYDLQFKDNTKYWCKGSVYELCEIVEKTPKNRKSETCSVADDKEKGVFTVTMALLSQSDQGLYWCVIARPGRNVYTRVRLRISHTHTVSPGGHSSEPERTIPRSETDTPKRPINNIYNKRNCNITVTTILTTTANSSPIQEQNVISWWGALRWILFILMLCCLASTHIAVWKINAARTTQLHRQSRCENPNIYA